MARAPRKPKAKVEAPEEITEVIELDEAPAEEVAPEPEAETRITIGMRRIGNFEWCVERVTTVGDRVASREILARDVKTMMLKKLRLELARA